jgi:DNA-binding MarR family transcriptional regulator
MAPLTASELQLCSDVRAICACNRLRRAARAMTRLYDDTMVSSGLKVTQLPILVGLGSAGDLPVSALAEALGLDRTTLTRNLKVLERRGLVSFAVDDEDARVRLVSLTEEGSRVLVSALARWQEVQESVQAQFGDQRLRTLYGELDTLAGAGGA